MQSSPKISILKAMGIEVWRDRFSETDEPLYFHTLRLEGVKSILILADYELEQRAEEAALLEAIAKALGFIVSSCPEVWADFADQISQYSALIVMGEKISAKIKSKKGEIIFTHSPSALLKDLKLKAQTWQAIRHLKI